MKKINMYEVDDDVYVQAKVIGMTIDDGEIKYKLRNTVTGKNYDHLFKADQLTMVFYPDRDENQEVKTNVKNTPPITEKHPERRK